jgi:hypothetical protein
MKENKHRADDRRTGFVCTELPFMAITGLSVALERRHIPDRRESSIRFGCFDKQAKD